MHVRWFTIAALTVPAVGTVSAAGHSIDELLDQIGPQPPEIVAFLQRPQVTILSPSHFEWKERPRVYIRQGYKVQDGCGFGPNPRSIATSGHWVSETIANDFTACEVLVIGGEIKD